MSEPPSNELEHLKDAEVAAYLDRGLSVDKRDRIEAHLAACAECRRDVREAQQLLKRVGPMGRASFLGGSIVAAAAVLLLIARLGPRPAEQIADTTIVRAENTASQLMVYGPTGEDKPVRGLRFVWGAASGALTYRLTVTRRDGETVWSRSGADTAVTLPDSVVLRSGQSYFWVADALLSDGTTRSTGIRELTSAR